MRRLTRLFTAFAALGLLLVAAPAAASAATSSWSSFSTSLLAAPTIVANLDDAPSYRLDTTANVAYQNGYAYTVQSNLNRLSVVDVHTPASPALVSSIQDPVHLDVPVWIVVQGHYAYISNKGAGNSDMTGSGLAIYDITNPASPAYVGSISNDTRLYGAYGLAVVGSVAYIAAQGCVGGATCVNTAPGGNALTTVDVSNPATPQILGSVSSLPRTQHLDSVVVVGNRAYGTAFYTQRITSFDVGDPAHPSILGTLTDPELAFANDLQVQSHYAYVVDQISPGGRLTVVDITDPTTMSIVGSVVDNTSPSRLNYAYRVRINSRYAFVAAPRANALTVVDLANPASPQIVASVSDATKIASPVGFDLAGPDVYLGSYCVRNSSNACTGSPPGSFTVIDVAAYADTAPDTTIVAAPPGVSSSTSASFDFASSASGSTFTCSLDGAAPTTCSGPISYSSLAAGGHTFTVTASSGGVSDPTPASFAWTISTTPPDTSITSGPASLTTSTSATFHVASIPAGTTFLCQLDGGSWTPCGTVVNYTLPDGDYKFAVAATGAGGTDPTPATWTWTVDTTAPHTTINSAPPATTNSRSATIGFTANETATFQCRIDGGGWSACASPTTYSSLADGAHRVDVRATDTAGNVESTPASATWTVDTVAPHTTITSAPPATTTSTSASIAFAANEAATFQCRIDGGAWSACASPTTYSGLAPGAHAFSVRGTDAAGNVEPAPPLVRWTVATPPIVTPTAHLVRPSAVKILKGRAYHGRGGVSRLFSSDGKRLEIAAGRRGAGYLSDVYATGSVPASARTTVNRVTIDYAGNATPRGARVELLLYDWTTGRWVRVNLSRHAPTADRKVHWSTTTRPSRFISATGAIRFRITATAAKPLRSRTDLVRFTVTY